MKRIIIIFVCCGLLLLFLTYSGVFRDSSNPISVVDFYYQCMRNWEWFLAVPSYNSKTFNYEKEEKDYIQMKMFMLHDVDLKIIKEDAHSCDVQAILKYKDGRIVEGIVNLIKDDDKWLINTVSYE